MAENWPLTTFLETAQGAMETPPRDAIHDQPMHAARRATRSALAEIPVRLNMLSVHESGDDIPPQTNLRTPQGPWALNINVNVPASYMSPSPSPDELVIQQRGRRRMPVTWSPDLDAVKQQQQQHQHTPVKTSPAKNNSNSSGIVLRSTPRKRLLLDASVKDPFSTPEKVRRLSPTKNSPNSKKARVERLASAMDGPLDCTLLALSPQQLIDLVQQLVGKCPSIEQDIKEIMPLPDIRPMEDRLSELRKNIYKSLPNSRLTSKTDSPAFSRVSTHLSAFKKCLIDQLRQLTNSQNWGAVLEYVLMAWTYVRATPLWDNPPHNTCRRACFKSLTASCLSALKRGGPWTSRQLEHIEIKLESMVADSSDVQACIKHIAVLKK